MSDTTIAELKETTDFIKSKTHFKPEVGIILGSGLGSFVKEMNVDTTIPFHEIPNFSQTTVEGHKGNLILGTVGTTRVVALQGRIHYYEGHSMEKVAFPTRTMAMLGIKTLFITNSAGGMNENMESGDMMVIDDHINLMGSNPLTGPNLKQLGPRFPDMTEAYDKVLSNKLYETMNKHKIRTHRGVYCAVSGPTYETPAEIRYLKAIGGNAVGMSTAPEVIAANHLGLRVCAVSCITNKAAGLSKQKLSHDEVTETAKKVEVLFSAFVTDFISNISSL
jgi:purine-nucleoside phosphorylase